MQTMSYGNFIHYSYLLKKNFIPDLTDNNNARFSFHGK